MPDPHADTGEDFWIFRDGRSPVCGQLLWRDLGRSVQRALDQPGGQAGLLNGLILAGEFESALADAESVAAPASADLTDALADLYVDSGAAARGAAVTRIRALTARLDAFPMPAVLTTSPPEGFSFYALHPLDFARAAERMPHSGQPAAVVGVRSIGTTLSAVVAAVLKKNSVATQRITVRPSGHPYDRRTVFGPRQIGWIERWQEKSASYLVVDEGPGRSGSTFLSVGEALVRAGVPASRIILMGSVEPDPGALRARSAASRWQAFRYVKCASRSYSRFADHIYLGGGEWRRELLRDSVEWPACWPQMERLKFLSGDRTGFFKFEGLGLAGEGARARARSLADEGFGCPVEDAGDGFALYPAVPCNSPNPADVSRDVLERIARYCSFRTAEFRVENRVSAPLSGSLVFNVQQELGVELILPSEALESEHLLLADGRMQPYEWIRKDDGTLIKCDAVTHGDDHFFPGPCDIAWDLAGAAVEWRLDSPALDYLLLRFRALSGIDARPRIELFILAYAAFRMAFCKMAAGTVRGTVDEFPLGRAYRDYRSQVEHCLLQGTVAKARRGAPRIRCG
jgi:hypothetical protein